MLGKPSQPVDDELLVDLIPSRLDVLIAALDRRIGAQLDEILHHPVFQKLESAWRGLWLVVERTRFDENIQIELFDCSKEDLRRDFESTSAHGQGRLYRLVYKDAIGSGREPYGAVIANYEFGPEEEDVKLLRSCAVVAQLAVAPFVAAASPRFFGVESHTSLATLTHLFEAFEESVPTSYVALRQSEEARAVGLTLPRFLLRAPYEPGHSSEPTFEYTENIRSHDDLCWGNTSFAFATRLTDSFARFRWCPNIIGPAVGGTLDRLPRPPGAESSPTEIALTERREFILSECGLIPFAGRKGEGSACFYSANSLHEPKYFGTSEEGRAAETNYRLGTQLPYFFIIGRLVQYLKVVYRSYQHTFETRADAERELNDWVGQFVTDRSVVSAAIRGRKPLRKAQVIVTDSEKADEWYALAMKVRPHFKYMGAFFTLSLDNRIEKT